MFTAISNLKINVLLLACDAVNCTITVGSTLTNLLPPCTGLDKPWGLQEVEAFRFPDIRHMMVARLSAPRTDRLYLPGNILGTHFCEKLRRPLDLSAPGWIMSMTHSNDTFENRTRNLPARSSLLNQKYQVIVYLLTMELAFDLGSVLRWGKPNCPCL